MERHSDKVSIKMKKLDAVLMMGMVLMVLTFFAFSIWGCISAYNTIKEEAKEKVLRSSMAAASEVNRVLGIKLEVLSYIASMPEIYGMDFKEQKTYINGKDDQTGYHHLFVVDLEGNGYYFEEGVIRQQKEEEFFTNLMAHVTYITEPFYDEVYDMDTITLCVPIYRGGERVGFLCGVTGLEEVNNLIRRYSGSEEIVILNSKGEYVACKDLSLVRERKTIYDVVGEEVIRQLLDDRKLSDKEFSRAYALESRHYFVATTPVQDTDWVVMVSEKKNMISWEIIRIVVIFTFTILLLFILFYMIAHMAYKVYHAGIAEDANRAKSNFLSTMSHEIRTPMNAIVGMAEILSRSDLSEQDRQYVLNIKSAGNSLLAIINDILDISKIEAGKMELIEEDYQPVELLNDISSILLTRIGSKPVDLIYDVQRDLPAVLYGDAIKIRQIIINLANNAIKFTDEGFVRIKVSGTKTADHEIALRVEVKDSGQGIKEEDLKRLFSSFQQVDVKKNRNKEGTGLGLSISKNLVELMGGIMEVDSVYGRGSRFSFSIPQKTVEESSAFLDGEGRVIVCLDRPFFNMKDVPFSPSYKRQIVSGKEDRIEFTAPDASILVVDDNELNRKVARGLLEPLQMDIDTADSAQAAFDLMEKKNYQIVFMDHMMPE